MPAHSAGLAPATRVASRKLGPVAGTARRPARGPPGRRARWRARAAGARRLAITRSWASASMTAGRAPRPASRRCSRSSWMPDVAPRRRQVPGRAVEEVGPGGAPRRLSRRRPAGARRRSARRSIAATTRALDRAGVGDDAAGRRGGEHRGDASSASAGDRHGDERRLGAVERLRAACRPRRARPPRAPAPGRGRRRRRSRRGARARRGRSRPPISPVPTTRDPQDACAAAAEHLAGHRRGPLDLRGVVGELVGRAAAAGRRRSPRSGSGWTSTMIPSAPAAAAASDSGVTSARRPGGVAGVDDHRQVA